MSEARFRYVGRIQPGMHFAWRRDNRSAASQLIVVLLPDTGLVDVEFPNGKRHIFQEDEFRENAVPCSATGGIRKSDLDALEPIVEHDEGEALNWNSLIFGSFNRDEIRQAVYSDSSWQTLRASLLGTSPERKYAALAEYVTLEEDPEHPCSEYGRRQREIRVTNYVHCLRRGGLIK